MVLGGAQSTGGAILVAPKSNLVVPLLKVFFRPRVNGNFRKKRWLLKREWILFTILIVET